MLIFKFTKVDNASLVSHVDNLRAMTYIFRRAQLPAHYSVGFNPHMELGFSPPIPLGVESRAEYVSVKTDEKAFSLDRLNQCAPCGTRFLRCWCADVNLAAKFNRAQYLLQAQGVGDVAEQALAPNFSITYDERTGTVTKNVSACIFGVQRLDADQALVTLAAGNLNLRPDRLLLHLMRCNGLQGDYRIVKLAAFADDISADDYLDQLQGAAK